MGTGALAYPRTSAFEPSVATHPTDPDRIAVVYQRFAGGGTCGLDTTLRISHDGGATWRTAPGRPYAGSGRGPNIHAVIAWGPGPRPSSARLYRFSIGARLTERRHVRGAWELLQTVADEIVGTAGGIADGSR